jgi:PTH1 family peptidyl-tRNA hydrolase
MENLKVMVGLGNPGKQYARTRHNAGFLVLEELGSRAKVQWHAEPRRQARIARVAVGSEPVLLVMPETFMNSSGQAVRAVVDYYQVALANLLVIVDDADLPFGELRLRQKGSAGGHHGLESVAESLGTQDYSRLRVGIGRGPGAEREITDFVLTRFNADELKGLDELVKRAADQAECWAISGPAQAMTKYNGIMKKDCQ